MRTTTPIRMKWGSYWKLVSTRGHEKSSHKELTDTPRQLIDINTLF